MYAGALSTINSSGTPSANVGPPFSFLSFLHERRRPKRPRARSTVIAHHTVADAHARESCPTVKSVGIPYRFVDRLYTWVWVLNNDINTYGGRGPYHKSTMEYVFFDTNVGAILANISPER